MPTAIPARELVNAALVGVCEIIPANTDVERRFLVGAFFSAMIKLLDEIGSPGPLILFSRSTLSTMGGGPQQSNRWCVNFLIFFTLYVYIYEEEDSREEHFLSIHKSNFLRRLMQDNNNHGTCLHTLNTLGFVLVQKKDLCYIFSYVEYP